jgi:hypothetical protein
MSNPQRHHAKYKLETQAQILYNMLGYLRYKAITSSGNGEVNITPSSFLVKSERRGVRGEEHLGYLIT